MNVALANEPLQLGYIDIQRLRHSGRAPLILEQIGALGLVPVERDAEDDPPGWRRTEDSLHRRLQAGSEVLAFPRPFHAFGLRVGLDRRLVFRHFALHGKCAEQIFQVLEIFGLGIGY